MGYRLTSGRRSVKSGKVLWPILAVVGVLCCGGTAYFGFVAYNSASGFFKNAFSMAGCQVTMANLAQAARDYSIDNKGMLPKAATWQQDLAKAYKEISSKSSTQEKGSPIRLANIDGEMKCQDSDGSITGIAYNSEVAGKKHAELKSMTIIFFETKGVKKNQAMPYKALPKSESPVLVAGERRGWMTVDVAGGVQMDGKSMGNMR